MENEAAACEHKVDKSTWGPGPWQDEPDRLEFEAHGFPCLIVRVPSLGHLCGYVAVPPGHPWHGKGGDDIEQAGGEYIDVHGGLTYASQCAGIVCHVPKPGEPANVWWFGFDHAHCDDLSPGSAAFLRHRIPDYGKGTVYRDIAYVRAGCESLAAQAKAVSATRQR